MQDLTTGENVMQLQQASSLGAARPLLVASPAARQALEKKQRHSGIPIPGALASDLADQEIKDAAYTARSYDLYESAWDVHDRSWRVHDHVYDDYDDYYDRYPDHAEEDTLWSADYEDYEERYFDMFYPERWDKRRGDEVSAGPSDGMWGGKSSASDYYRSLSHLDHADHCASKYRSTRREFSGWKHNRRTNYCANGWHDCHERDKFTRARQVEQGYREIYKNF